MKKLLSLLILAAVGIAVFGCDDKMEVEPEHSNNLQEVSVCFTYNLSTDSGASMTKVSNADIFDRFYQRILSADLVADEFSLVLTEVNTGETKNFSGRWKEHNLLTLRTGTYRVTGVSTAYGDTVQEKCSFTFNEVIVVSASTHEIALTARYDCFLIVFSGSDIATIVNYNGLYETPLFSFEQYKYAFVNDKLYKDNYKNEAYVGGTFSDGAAFKCYTGDLAFEKGKYYVYSVLTGGFIIPGMEEGYSQSGYGNYTAVDLGLSVKWASFNIGASAPEEHGDYFAWGEIETKSEYNWETYKYGSSSSSLTKYNFWSSYGTVDNLDILEAEDDVAYMKWGGDWRMPTKEEIEELLCPANCDWEKTTLNGVSGYLVTSKRAGYTDKWIFLPNSDLSNPGGGRYWSSSLCTGTPDGAFGIYFYLSSLFVSFFSREGELTVRPVISNDDWTYVSSIQLNHPDLDLYVSETEAIIATVLPANASNSQIEWSSNNTSIATVSSTGIVTAIAEGNVTIIAEAKDGSGERAFCNVVVHPVSVPEMIDLGLPSGLKWASFNLGASSPEEYGDYYAWGETEPYYLYGHAQDNPCSDWRDGKSAGYNWSSYKWCNGSLNSLIKYNTNDSYGTVDNKTVIASEDDAAYVKLGGSWHIPTNADWHELREYCTWTWTDNYNGTGVKGRIVSGTNSNSIFLPAAGYRFDTTSHNVGSWGFYWSSSICTDTDQPYYAWYYDFNSNNPGNNGYGRFSGSSIRPVTQ